MGQVSKAGRQHMFRTLNVRMSKCQQQKQQTLEMSVVCLFAFMHVQVLLVSSDRSSLQYYAPLLVFFFQPNTTL